MEALVSFQHHGSPKAEARLDVEIKSHEGEHFFSLGWFTESLAQWQEDALVAAISALSVAVGCDRLSAISWPDSSVESVRDDRREYVIRTGAFDSRPAWLYTLAADRVHDLLRLAWRFDRVIIFCPANDKPLTAEDLDALLDDPVARTPLAGLPLLVHGTNEHLWVDIHSGRADRDLLLNRVEARLAEIGITTRRVVDQM